MGQKNSIQDLAPFNITYFFLRDEEGENWLATIGYDFGDEFVYNIVKGYGSKFIWECIIIFLYH